MKKNNNNNLNSNPKILRMKILNKLIQVKKNKKNNNNLPNLHNKKNCLNNNLTRISKIN